MLNTKMKKLEKNSLEWHSVMSNSTNVQKGEIKVVIYRFVFGNDKIVQIM